MGLLISDKTEVSCPKCGGLFASRRTPQGIEVEYCQDCKSVWLDKGEVNAFIEGTQRLDNYALSNGFTTDQACPSCGSQLERGNWTSENIILEKCPNCGGILFEEGELSLIARLYPDIEKSLLVQQGTSIFQILKALVPLINLVALISFTTVLVWQVVVSNGFSAILLVLIGLFFILKSSEHLYHYSMGNTSVRTMKGLRFPLAAWPIDLSAEGFISEKDNVLWLEDQTGSFRIGTRFWLTITNLFNLKLIKSLANIANKKMVVRGRLRLWPFNIFRIYEINCDGKCLYKDNLFIRRIVPAIGVAIILLGMALIVAPNHELPQFSQEKETLLHPAEYLTSLAILFAYQHDEESAIEFFEKAVATDREEPEDDRTISGAYYNYAIFMLNRGELDKAGDLLLKSIQKDPGNKLSKDAILYINKQSNKIGS